MSKPAISLPYNLGRLGKPGDEIRFEAGEVERAALAAFADILSVTKFSAHIVLKKLSPTHFAVLYELAADVLQACVVTLEPLAAKVRRDFARELHFSPPLRGPAGEAPPAREIVFGAEDDETPEEIDNLHQDLAIPLLEEFLLSIAPYPRAPGVEFAPPSEGDEAPQSPFAVLKDRKSGR